MTASRRVAQEMTAVNLFHSAGVVEFFGISILKNVGPTKAMIWGCEIWFCSNLAGEKIWVPHDLGLVGFTSYYFGLVKNTHTFQPHCQVPGKSIHQGNEKIHILIRQTSIQ